MYVMLLLELMLLRCFSCGFGHVNWRGDRRYYGSLRRRSAWGVDNTRLGGSGRGGRRSDGRGHRRLLPRFGEEGGSKEISLTNF